MGIYWFAIDIEDNLIIKPPKHFNNKTPGLFNPLNPFSQMVMMKNSQGCNFELTNDCSDWCYSKLTDITEEVYKEFLEYFPENKSELIFKENALKNIYIENEGIEEVFSRIFALQVKDKLIPSYFLSLNDLIRIIKTFKNINLCAGDKKIIDRCINHLDAMKLLLLKEGKWINEN